jgi:amino acid transporter
VARFEEGTLSTTRTTVAGADAGVQAHQAELRKELGLLDVVLAQITYVVTLEFFGTAAKAGSSHAVLWLAAIFLFFVPQALVVRYLNQLMPLEGGLYEWARLAFNDATGFLVAWNLWLFVVLLVAEYGFVLVTYFAFALGPGAAWMASSKWLTVIASAALVGGLVWVSALGLRVGKWVTNAGGALTVIALGVLILLPVFHPMRGTFGSYHPLPLVRPAFSLFSLSVFTKMTFGALCGFEFVAIFAGECRNPARTLARSVLFAAPIIAFLYVFSTSAILAFLPSGQVNLIGPVPQALSVGLNSFGLANILAPVTILLLLGNTLSTANLTFSASSRLPMVAGWDNLLPKWFTRLHPKYKTPTNSILFIASVTLAASVVVLIGVNEEEAFSLIQIWGFTLYGLAYLVMFAIPLVGNRKVGIQPAMWLRLAACSGFTVTLLFVVLSVFPVIDVPNPVSYAWKTVAVVVGVNTLGAILYTRRKKRSTFADPLGR